MISLVFAESWNGKIGRDGGLPWHHPADLRHFKSVTTGKVVVMGRKTYESLPSPTGLPNRKNVVLTTDYQYKAHPTISVAHSESAVLASYGDLMVIGGRQIYKLFLPHATRIYKTLILADYEGDTEFPYPVGWFDDWELIESIHWKPKPGDTAPEALFQTLGRMS